jgi:signal transduction histidine kinase
MTTTTSGGRPAPEAPAAAQPRGPLHEEGCAIIAMAAHELKNALGGVGVALAHCEQRLSSGAGVNADDLSLARAELRRLAGMVDDLLDGTRLDLGMIDVMPQPVDVAALVREAVAVFRELHGRPVAVDLPASLPAVADGNRVRSVLVNYLENAAKYALPPASITVRAGAAPGRPGWLRLEVTDTGPGIAPDDQARLFQRFFRAPTAARRVSGLGLGLFFCRSVADAHGGAVGVDSAPGAGATFWLHLPQQPGS